MSRRYARAPRGERAILSEPFARSSNHTLVGALSSSGITTSMLIEGAMDGTAFIKFIRHYLVPILSCDTLVIMDNLPAHKVTGVREAIEEAGASLIYLPPYSPEFNPIEECWSKIKELVRSYQPTDYATLLKFIVKAISSITQKDCTGWFQHAGYCF